MDDELKAIDINDLLAEPDDEEEERGLCSHADEPLDANGWCRCSFGREMLVDAEVTNRPSAPVTAPDMAASGR